MGTRSISRSRQGASGLLLLLLFAASSAEGKPRRRKKPVPVEAPIPAKPPDAPETPRPLRSDLDPHADFAWRQILSVPRIGGRLRSVAVDPDDPRRVFVGTQEGTVLRTLDGGVTWMEHTIQPSAVFDRSLGLTVPGLPELGEETPNNFQVFVDAPDLQYTDRVEIPAAADPFPVRPSFFFAGFLAETQSELVEDLLGNVTASRHAETQPTERIVLCRGGRYPLLVVTRRDLWGSTDDGETYVRLFANPGRSTIASVACNPSNADQIAVASSVGLFMSTDGGLTFDVDLLAWPGQPVTAVAFGPGPEGAGTRLYAAFESELLAGDPTKSGLDYIYPNDDASTAPWLDIYAIATTPEGVVWLATEDGARVSPDAGRTWVTASRTLFSRQSIDQIALGENAHGEIRVAALLTYYPTDTMQDAMVYASDDGGSTWRPFFSGLSRRTIHQIARVTSEEGRPPGWWVVTSGEVWTTYPAELERRDPDAKSRSWARARLASTPEMAAVIDGVLEGTGLSNASIERIVDLHRGLNWVPRLDMLFEAGDITFASARGETPGIQRQLVHSITAGEAEIDYAFFIQASWELYDTIQQRELVEPTRNELHELRRQIAFAAEDAWHERVLHLRALAEGMSDPIQIETLEARILSLEAVLEVWLGHPIHHEEK